MVEREYRRLRSDRGAALPEQHAQVMFRVYSLVEEAAQEFLGDHLASLLPLPPAVLDFARTFVDAFQMCERRTQERLATLRAAMAAFDAVREYEMRLNDVHDSLEPLVNQVTENRVKRREEAARFERIARRAREIAESEMVEGLQDVLYGDAPGQDLQQEFKDAKNQLSAATAMIIDLRSVLFASTHTFFDLLFLS
jgi:hypothetical protein